VYTRGHEREERESVREREGEGARERETCVWETVYMSPRAAALETAKKRKRWSTVQAQKRRRRRVWATNTVLARDGDSGLERIRHTWSKTMGRKYDGSWIEQSRIENWLVRLRPQKSSKFWKLQNSFSNTSIIWRFHWKIHCILQWLEFHKSRCRMGLTQPSTTSFPVIQWQCFFFKFQVYIAWQMLLHTAWHLYCPWVSAAITHLTCAVSELLPLLPDLSSHSLQIPGISSIFRSSYSVFCV